MVKQTHDKATKKTAKSSGARPRAPIAPLTAKASKEDDDRIYVLVRAVVEAGGLPIDPQWVMTADAAERRGFLTRLRLQLFPTKLGEQLVKERAPEPTSNERTMVKTTETTRFQLKSIAKEQGVTMFDTLVEIIKAVYENRDELTRQARAAGAQYPWEALTGKRR
jgi:hypothetical protein